MDGEDDMSDHIARHEDDIKQLVHGSRGGAASLKAELEHLKRKREAIEAEPDPVAEIQKHLLMIEEDKEKLQKYLREKKSYSEKLHSMVNNLTTESSSLKHQMSLMEKDQSRLQVIYDAQDMTPADLQKINLERGELRQKNKEALKRKDELNEMLGAKQMEIAKIRGDTEKIINDYNARVREARMVPETNENAFGFNLGLSTSTGGAEIMGRLKEAITHVFKALQDKSNNLEVELLELKQKLEEWEDRLKISHQELTTKERRLETLDSEYEQRKGENASDIESRRRLAEEASQETAQLRSRLAAFNSTEGEIKENCRQETAKLDQVKKKHGKELDDAMNALTRLCHMAIEHKEAVTQRKKESLQEKRQIVDKMEKYNGDYEVWRKTFRAQIDDARAELKKRCDEAMVVADKALEDYEQFRKQCEEEDRPTPLRDDSAEADDAMEVEGDHE